jgi:hypothetical protein
VALRERGRHQAGLLCSAPVSQVSPCAELGAKLLRAADVALLDAPLGELAERLGDDEARALFRHLDESGEAASLRELLDGGRLERWVAETCTAREEDAVLAQLRRWLGLGEGGGDDPARLAELAPLPDDAEALVAWARQHGVVGELMRPLREVLSGEPRASQRTLLEALAGPVDASPRRGGSLLADADVRERARAYLCGEAASHVALGVRERLWQSPPPDGPLRPLVERLRALLVGTEPAALAPVRFVPARPVALALASGVCQGELCVSEGSLRVRLLLSGFEQRPIEGDCDRCRTPRCVHVRALAGRLLDACLREDDRLHAPLCELVRVPSWRRFLAALEPEVTDGRSAASQLCFVVRLAGGAASIGAFQQRGGSPGRLVSAAKLARSSRTSDLDRPALEAMAAASRTLGAQFVPADMALWRALVEHPSVRLEGSSEPLRIVEDRADVSLTEQPDGLAPAVSLAGVRLAPGARGRDVSYLLAHDAATSTLTVAPLTPALGRLLAALAHFRGVLPPESYGLLAPSLVGLRKVARVASPKALEGREQPPPRKLLLRITPLLDEGVDVELTMRALPLGALWPPGQGPELVHGLGPSGPLHARRDLAFEREAARLAIEQLGLAELLRVGPFAYRVEDTQGALELLARAARLGELLDLEWSERAPRLSVVATVKSADLKIGLFKRGEWLTLRGGAQVAGRELAIARLLEAARRGERFVALDGQSHVELERELFERLRAAQLCVQSLEKDAGLSPAAAPFWLARLGDVTEGEDNESTALLERAGAGSGEVELAPAQLAHLRDYQRRGVAWLLSRTRWAPGACIADEMGLGKTVQTLAVLGARAALGPALVLAPTSVVGNWRAELARFAPELQVRVYQGSGRRQLLERVGPGAVLVTSYELLLRDRAHFDELSFATLVVDEAQVLKNARTLRARAVHGLNAAFRIALSGTPVENRLGDLWSLFQIVAPGLLGSWPRFRARFAVPIERYDNEERAAALRALVAPLILRRTKDDVAPELPARTEVVHFVELSPAEQELYDGAVAHARKAIGRQRRDEGARRVQILAELTRLRQLACHPRLVLDDARAQSSKLAALLSLLDDILPRGHRALLFSQFVRHLELVREALEQRGISSLYLDGSTPAGQRAGLVERFQAGEGQLFLISLKAGGTGLNLTGADYVVHLDPWWNPAAEAQASDRVHRLGQERPVTLVKLVVQGTIEERVLGLHEHKRRLAATVLSGTDLSGLDADALEDLLSEPP